MDNVWKLEGNPPINFWVFDNYITSVESGGKYDRCLCFSVVVKVTVNMSYWQWWACWNCFLLDWRVWNHPYNLLRSCWSYTTGRIVWASTMTWAGSLTNIFSDVYIPCHLALTIRLIQPGLTRLSHAGGNTAVRSETSILITGIKSNPW